MRSSIKMGAIALVLDESGIDSSHLVPVLKSTQT